MSKGAEKSAPSVSADPQPAMSRKTAGKLLGEGRTRTKKLARGVMTIQDGVPSVKADVPEVGGRPANDATFQGVINRHNGTRTMVLIKSSEYPGPKGDGIWYSCFTPKVLDEVRRLGTGDVVCVRLERGYIAHISTVLAPPKKEDAPSEEVLNARARLAQTARENIPPPPPLKMQRIKCPFCNGPTHPTQDEELVCMNATRFSRKRRRTRGEVSTEDE